MSYDFDDPRRFDQGEDLTVEIVTVPAGGWRPAGVGRSFDERFPPLPPERDTQTRARWANATPRRKRPATPTTYLIGIEGSPFVKIGYTGGDPRRRVRELQTGQPMQLTLLWSCLGDFEADLHVRFDAYRHRGEWFDLSPLGDPVSVVAAAVEEARVATQ